MLKAVIKTSSGPRTFFVKVLRESAYAPTLQRHELLRRARFPAALVAAATADFVLVLHELPGRPLAQAIFDEAMPCTAESMIMLLDSMPSDVVALPRRPPWTGAVGTYAEMIAAALPVLDPQLQWLVAQVSGGLAGAQPGLEPTHGDFHEGQLFVSNGLITGLLDIDTMGPGGVLMILPASRAPFHDAANDTEQAAGLTRLINLWLQVFDTRVDPADLRLRAAGVIVSLATGPYRSQEPNWQAETTRMIESAVAPRRARSASDRARAPRIVRRCPGRTNERTRFMSASERGRQRLKSAILASGASSQALREQGTKQRCEYSRVSALTESGTPFKAVYGPEDLAEFDPDLTLGEPGHYPYTRGIHPSMYTTRPWTMRQYAGFGTAAESNARYRELIAHGTAGLSVAFDLPTQMGYDSDAPIAAGEVGKVGVAIDSIEDMRELFAAIPLDKVSTSMTINAPAALLLLLYQLVAEEQGVPAATLSGTIQNDVLKEYIARGTYIFPPAASLRLVSDTFGYCRDHLPRWNTISISGYHMAEAGATPAQEIAFTLTNGIAYVEAALAAGLAVDDFAPRLSFFFVSRTTLLEEVAKFRAARRIWAQLMRDHFGAHEEKSMMLRFHSQTAGVQLTAQQPEVNLVRVAVQALAAVLGGTQSLHTNSFDEAIALPTPKAARLAVRTQQVLAYETDVTKTVDPFAGSYVVESLTNDVEAESRRLMEAVAERGGAVSAIEQGFQKAEIERAAYQVARQIDAGERVVVGVNRFQIAEEEPYEPLQVDPAIEMTQAAKLAALRADRDQEAVDAALAEVRAAARGTGNVLIPLKEALRLRATVGEVCDALRDVRGVYRPKA